MIKSTNQKTRKIKVESDLEVKIKEFDLQRMMEGFILEQNCRGNSKATVKYYEGNILRFISYLDEQKIASDTSSITKLVIQKYILHLKTSKKWVNSEHIKSEEKIASKSIQTYIRAIKAWIAWMEDEGYLDKNVSTEIRLPKATRKIMEILSEEDINEIFKYLETKSENHFRDILIIMVLLECGLRLEEATTLKLQNINIKQNTMKVLGKGNKERIISYGVNVQKMFFKYINQERPEPINKKVDGLFLKSDGSPITQSTIKQLFRRIKDKLKMEKFHPHLCRHTYCTMYLANGGDIFALKQSTGHESFEILNNYVHLASAIVNMKTKSLSLLDGMKLKI